MTDKTVADLAPCKFSGCDNLYVDIKDFYYGEVRIRRFLCQDCGGWWTHRHAPARWQEPDAYPPPGFYTVGEA